jgi:hypothetical protein
METAKYNTDNKKHIETLENYNLPEWFIYPLKYEDTTRISFEQIMILFNWYELKMNDKIEFKLINVSEPFEGTTNQIENENDENETLCKFTFLCTRINNFKKPKTKVKLFTFVNENEKETFAVFIDKIENEKISVYSNVNLHSDNYYTEYLNKCRKPTNEERNLLIRELIAIGYDIEEVY